MNFEQARKLRNRVGDKDFSMSQMQKAFDDIRASEKEIVADISKFTIKQLQRYVYSRPGEKKDYYVRDLWKAIIQGFHISDSMISYNPFDGQTYEGQLTKAVKAQTQADLDTHIAKVAADKAAKAKAIENPETLDEFRTFFRVKGRDSLSAKQSALYDQLIADATIKNTSKEDEGKRTIAQADLDGTEMTLHKTVHSKKGHDVWVVKLSDRISKDAYRDLNGKAKRLGGYYSRYSRDGAIPGFQFKTEAEAKQFMSLKEGSVTKESNAAQKAMKASDKLKAMAAKWEVEGYEKLNQPRKTNTNKRAREAGYAEQDAQAKIYNAKLMVSIANALEEGKVKYLNKITAWSQLSELLSLLRQANYRRIQKENIPMNEQTVDYALDIPFAEYPYPRIYKDHYLEIAHGLEDERGYKQLAARMLKYAKTITVDDHIQYRKVPDNGELRKIMRSKYFQKRFSGSFIPESVARWERLQRIGITNPEMLRTALRELAAIKQGTTALSPEEQAELELKQAERKFINTKEKGFFPTPTNLADEVVRKAEIEPDHTILEPSAGLGHLADAIRNQHPDNQLDVVEWWNDMRDFLTKKGHNVIDSDIFNVDGQYDRIVMNPPFEKLADIDHVRKAFDLLKPGGRLVAIMAANKQGSRSKVTEFNEFVDENGYSTENPAGAFKSSFRPTGVNTITVVLDKDEAQALPAPNKKPCTDCQDKALTDPHHCDDLEQDIAHLEREQAEKIDHLNEDVPDLIILENMPLITPVSAEVETGGKVGTKGDISIGLTSRTKGVTVEHAAESLKAQFGTRLPSENEIRDTVIEILKTGKVNYRQSILGDEKELTDRIKDKTEQIEAECINDNLPPNIDLSALAIAKAKAVALKLKYKYFGEMKKMVTLYHSHNPQLEDRIQTAKGFVSDGSRRYNDTGRDKNPAGLFFYATSKSHAARYKREGDKVYSYTTEGLELIDVTTKDGRKRMSRAIAAMLKKDRATIQTMINDHGKEWAERYGRKTTKTDVINDTPMNGISYWGQSATDFELGKAVKADIIFNGVDGIIFNGGFGGKEVALIEPLK